MRLVSRYLGGVLVCALWAGSASAYFLDNERRFDFRLRAYTQWSVMAESSERTRPPARFCGGSPCPSAPKYSAGDLAQIRNFYNPEFDAKLGDFTGWMKDAPGLGWLAPDDFRFRAAWWGFYDAVYDEDFANSPWRDNARKVRARFSKSNNPKRESYRFNDEFKDYRDVYAKQNRINELYLDYSKGRVFVRAGRQAISWGESDTIALVDNQNPFDLTLGAPGFFQDLDESRIPLWTLRTTVKLIDNWKWLSSFFFDGYIVPGVIDTNHTINPMTAGVSPFGADVPDPQLLVPNQMVPTPDGLASIRAVVVDRELRQTWGNSRWGARLTGVLARDYTVQAFFYRSYSQAPVPLLASPGGAERGINGSIRPRTLDRRGRKSRCKGGPPCTNLRLPAVTILEREAYYTAAVAATWYSQPLNGIIRTQANLYIDEPAFIPSSNLNPSSQLPRSIYTNRPNTKLEHADFLRFVLGYDRFFFFRPLNPSNSFTFISSFTGSWNLSETGRKDYRNFQPKPHKPATRNVGTAFPDPNDRSTWPKIRKKDYEDLYPFEGFFNFVLQTDYMHGKLQPRIVAIIDPTGIFGFQTSFIYRLNDNVLAQVQYLSINASRKSGLATFRAHDMVQFRLTAQIN